MKFILTLPIACICIGLYFCPGWNEIFNFYFTGTAGHCQVQRTKITPKNYIQYNICESELVLQYLILNVGGFNLTRGIYFYVLDLQWQEHGRPSER